jgi:hypothetical protein
MRKLFRFLLKLFLNIGNSFKNLYTVNKQYKNSSYKRNLIVNSYIDNFDDLISIS